jgi:hypothetical protein
VRVDGPDGYWVTDDPALLDVARIHRWLSRDSYWARGRSYPVMARAIEHSLSAGLYAANGTQAGYARIVTDRATFARAGPFTVGWGLATWHGPSGGWNAGESPTASGTSPARRPTGDQEMRDDRDDRA